MQVFYFLLGTITIILDFLIPRFVTKEAYLGQDELGDYILCYLEDYNEDLDEVLEPLMTGKGEHKFLKVGIFTLFEKLIITHKLRRD